MFMMLTCVRLNISLFSRKVYFHRCFDFSANCFVFLYDTNFKEIINICQIHTNKKVCCRKGVFSQVF